MADALVLDAKRTALVLIDLQNGIASMPLAPRSGAEVVEAGKALAARFREAGAPVFLVHVGWAPDGADRPSRIVDKPSPVPPGGLPPEWMQCVEGLADEGDIRIHKRQWGASPARRSICICAAAASRRSCSPASRPISESSRRRATP